MMKALFAGTFDPPTFGHIDLIQRASKICDHLIVAIGVNMAKKEQSFFDKEEILILLKEFTSKIQNVEVCTFSGLLVDFAKKKQAQFLIRSMRSTADLEYEMQMARANHQLSGLETIFLMANAHFEYISSSLIRELGFYRANLAKFVPPAVEKHIYEKLNQHSR